MYCYGLAGLDCEQLAYTIYLCKLMGDNNQLFNEVLNGLIIRFNDDYMSSNVLNLG